MCVAGERRAKSKGSERRSVGAGEVTMRSCGRRTMKVEREATSQTLMTLLPAEATAGGRRPPPPETP